MNRIYISGAITGTSDYMERFAEAEKILTDRGYSVINPAKILSNMPSDTEYEEYMQVSLLLINMCDTLYQLKDWQHSKGANREYNYALQRRIKIIGESGCIGER